MNMKRCSKAAVCIPVNNKKVFEKIIHLQMLCGSIEPLRLFHTCFPLFGEVVDKVFRNSVSFFKKCNR